MSKLKKWFLSIPVQFVLILFSSLLIASYITLTGFEYFFIKANKYPLLFSSDIAYQYIEKMKDVTSEKELIDGMMEHAEKYNGELWLFNEEGNLISNTDGATDVYQTIGQVDKEIYKNKMSEDYYRTSFLSHGKLYYIFIKKDWGIVDVRNWNMRLLVLIVICSIFICVTILTYYLLTRRKMKQLKDIFEGISLMKQEQEEVKIRRRTKDQFGDLAISINEMYESVLTSKQQSITLEKQKNELITNMAHDLRTPLTTILGYLQLLNKDELTDENKLYVERTLEQANRLKGLTDNLFDLAKLQSVENLHEKEHINMVMFLYQIFDKWEPLLENRKLVLHLEDKPFVIEGNATLLLRTFDNLFSNVKKHGKNEGEVVLSCSGEGDKVKICICNEANPLRADELHALFERFYVSDVSRSNHNNSGVGLAIVKEIVSIHKGTVSASQKDGKISIVMLFPIMR